MRYKIVRDGKRVGRDQATGKTIFSQPEELPSVYDTEKPKDVEAILTASYEMLTAGYRLRWNLADERVGERLDLRSLLGDDK